MNVIHFFDILDGWCQREYLACIEANFCACISFIPPTAPPPTSSPSLLPPPLTPRSVWFDEPGAGELNLMNLEFYEGSLSSSGACFDLVPAVFLKIQYVAYRIYYLKNDG